jgi:hypothetical protein
MKRYMRIDGRLTHEQTILVALDKLGIEYQWHAHDEHISIIEIDVDSLAKSYHDAVWDE